MQMTAIGGRVLTFGEFIRRERGRRGLTQQNVADAIERPGSYVSRLERDNFRDLPDPLEMRRIAEVLGCSESDLLRAAGYLMSVEHAEPAAMRTMTEDNARLDQLPPKQRRILERIINDFFAEEEEPYSL